MRGTETYLQDAVNWFKQNEIPLHGILRNPNQGWTNSPKAYAQLYIDDAAMGASLTFDSSKSSRPFIDWNKATSMLIHAGILTQ
jgi:hypothetical protein